MVMKFGGTSVADQAAIERLDRDRPRRAAGRGAARGRGLRAGRWSWCRRCRGVTDRLLSSRRAASAGDVEGARDSLQDLRARHIKVSEVDHRRDAARRRRGVIDSRVRRARAHRLARWRCCGKCRRAGSTPSPRPARSSAASIVAAALTSHGIARDLGRCARGDRHRRRAHGRAAADSRRPPRR